jgi:hypothetical protein
MWRNRRQTMKTNRIRFHSHASFKIGRGNAISLYCHPFFFSSLMFRCHIFSGFENMVWASRDPLWPVDLEAGSLEAECHMLCWFVFSFS